MPTPVEILQGDLDGVNERLQAAQEVETTFSGMSQNQIRRRVRRIFRFAGFDRDTAQVHARTVAQMNLTVTATITALQADKTALESAITSLGGTPT